MTKTTNANPRESFEIVSTKFIEGITLDEQKKAMTELNQFIQNFDGFKSRNYYYSEKESRWVDFILWNDEESANAASEEMMQIPEVTKIFSMLDMEATSFSCYHQIGELKSSGMQW